MMSAKTRSRLAWVIIVLGLLTMAAVGINQTLFLLQALGVIKLH